MTMPLKFPPMLSRLWSLAEQEATRSGRSAAAAFDPIGLILAEELDDFDYDSTPLNVSTFARTGSDGVHYSLLHIDGQVTDQSPVVMCVPIVGVKGNRIVGENLHDFLCLGCQTGYVWLDELVYDRAKTISKLLHPDQFYPWWDGEDYANDLYSQEEMQLLLLLREEFGLSPWAELESHLIDLQTRYMHRLVVIDPDRVDDVQDRTRRHFAEPDYDSRAPFLMTIQDVFSINGQTSVAGRIQRGVISQGDTVEIVDDCSNIVTGVVSETILSLLSDISDPAASTDKNQGNRNLGLVFFNVDKDQIKRGMLVAAPGSMKCSREYRADIYIYTLAESGYETDIPLEPENRSRFYIFECERYGHVILPQDIPALMPGQEMNLLVELNKPQALAIDVRFPLWVDPPGSSRKWIGEGKVTALID